MVTEKKPVTERALLARINRALRVSGRVIKATREDSPAFRQTGRYYLLDLGANGIIGHDVDLERFARGMSVIHPHEMMIEAIRPGE